MLHVYEQRKKLGHIFIPEKCLWQNANRFSFSHLLREPPLINEDLRDQLDSLPSTLPVEGIIFDLLLKTVRERVAEDYFTYSLDRPPVIVPGLFDDIFSDLESLCKVRNFILESFCGHADRGYLKITGDPSSLFTRLAKLTPLVQRATARFYCERDIGLKSLREIASARLLCVNIGTHTARVAEPKRAFSTQYRALVACQEGINVQRSLAEVDDELTAGEVLSWVLGAQNVLKINLFS